MSACFSAASGRTYGFDFDFVKSPSPSTRTSDTSSSPSSTISESSDSPLAISTRKPRTPRKRPNQTYNEAAAMLSSAYPNLFPTESLKKPGKFTRPNDTDFWNESSELLLPFRVFDGSSFLLKHKPEFPMEPKAVNLQENPCQSPGDGEISSRVNTLELVDDDCREDFDAESILDEEIAEGIDSIMGSRAEDSSGGCCHGEHVSPWTGDSMGFGFGGKFDFRRRALRGVDEGNNWWNFPAVVDMLQITPKIKEHPPPPAASASPETKKNKKKKEEKKKETKKVDKPTTTELPKESSIPKSNPGLLLKLNYNGVLNAWSDQGSPFAGESPCSDVPGDNVTGQARLAQIDLLWDNGGVMREASVLRYKEKHRTRLFSNKIRYQVRKVNADGRLRLKGRFVGRANCCSNAKRS